MHIFTVFALGKFKIGVCQGVLKPYFEPFLPIFRDFLSFSSVLYVRIMLYLVHNQFRVSQFICSLLLPWENSKLGSVRGYVNPILSHCCLFSAIFCLFLQFSTLESCYIWFTISLEYPSAYVQSCCLGKIQNQGLSGGIRGYKNTILSHFCLFFEIFCLFLQFSTL